MNDAGSQEFRHAGLQCGPSLESDYEDTERKAWADLPEQRSTTHPNNVPDPRELKRDADELAQLSQAISADFEAMSRGLVSSNLNERLKRIEKLSKRLRNAVESSSR